MVICHWFKGSEGPNYLQAAANTRVMGAIVARILEVLVSVQHVNLATSTIVGFSLGAHIAGFAGHRLKGIKRIIGEQLSPEIRADTRVTQ